MAYGCTPRELLSRLTQQEWLELQAYAEIEPFGDRAVQTTTAMLSQIVWALGTTKEAPRYPVDQFMPGRTREKTDAELAAERKKMLEATKAGLRAQRKRRDSRTKRQEQ